MGFFIGAVVVAAFVLLLAAVAWWDIRAYRIPNVLVAAFFLVFLLALAGGLIPRNQIIGHFGAGLLALLLGMALFYRNWIGGGDAKLFVALALWAGWPEVIRFATVMALAGGVISALVLLSARGTGRVKNDGSDAEGGLDRRVPYGVAIALAGLDFWIWKLAAPFIFS